MKRQVLYWDPERQQYVARDGRTMAQAGVRSKAHKWRFRGAFVGPIYIGREEKDGGGTAPR